VFLGGACNWVDESGQLQRNKDRDWLIEELGKRGYWVFVD